MEPRITIEPITFPTDHRGLVLEPLGPEAIPGQRNVHLALTGPGHVRGNHYHRRGTEVAVVLGPALFRFREGGQTRDLRVEEGQAFRLTIPPGVPHAFQNPGGGTMVIVAFNSTVHDPEDPDVVREVLIET
jgi:UDP-2-acetamido-2,6-beta-L-arabino-hexul-4-ose reductase